jgi:hypothetical protein
MPHLAQYDRTTGAIVSVWSAAEHALLLAQVQAEDVNSGYLLCGDEVPVRLLEERYEVREGQLAPRQELQLVAAPATFAADGRAECVVQTEPFVPCTLVVELWGREEQVTLREGDAQLILTADTPQFLGLRVAPLPGYWAAPIRVEAR